MTEREPLSALLSRTLVAFTIELDNEFERELPHRTTEHGAVGDGRSTPWLASYHMWANFLRFVSPEGIRVGELATRPGVARWAFDGMRRWGYVCFESDNGERLRKPTQRSIVRLRRGGRAAAALWPTLPAEIEARWRARFGHRAVTALRRSLEDVAAGLPAGMPDYLPPGDYWMRAQPQPDTELVVLGRAGAAQLDLTALLSQVLLVFAIDYERGFAPSLSLGANVVRNLDAEPIRMRELPPRVGVAKEVTGLMVHRLEARGLVRLSPDPSGRGKLVALTDAGALARGRYPRRAASVENAWRREHGEAKVQQLRAAVEALARDGGHGRAPIWEGLEPSPENWRAAVRRPQALPHYPVVTHRGGYPDGS